MGREDPPGVPHRCPPGDVGDAPSPPGIVASNTRDTSVGATYPHLNFCIPVTVLQPLVARYRRTGDPDAFTALNRAGEEVRAAWRLQRQPGPPSKL